MLLLWANLALAQTPSIGLSDALDHARTHNAQVEAADWGVKAAAARQTQAATEFAPRVNFEAGVQWWDSAIVAEFIDAGEFDLQADFGGLLQDYINLILDEFQAEFEGLVEPIVIREKRTANLKATAALPLTGMVPIGLGHSAANHARLAARAERTRTQQEVSVQVVQVYTGALAAEELVAVSDAVVANLESAVSRVTAFNEAGLVQRNELLQVQVALGNAKLQAKKARQTRALTQRQLALVVGHDAPELSPEPLPEDILPALPDLEAGVGRVGDRAAIDAMTHQVAAAKAGRMAQNGLLLPQISAVAQWERQAGVGQLAVPEQAFIGLQASFDLWGFGKQNAKVREATAQLRQAEAGQRALAQSAEIEARGAYDAAVLARDKIDIMVEQVAQAEENLRLVDARFDVQLANATDRLEAERLLAQARIEMVAARFEYLTALADWQRLTAVQVDPLGGPK